MNALKTKIEEVKAKLGLTQMQLSERIGKNPYYLDTVKHRGVTTERQEELIRELDLVANGGTVMTEREIIADLSEQLAEAQDKLQKAQEVVQNISASLKKCTILIGINCKKQINLSHPCRNTSANTVIWRQPFLLLVSL